MTLYNRDSDIGLIVDLYLQVLAYAMDRDWPIENIKIFILPSLAGTLKLKGSLFIEYKGIGRDISIIRDKTILEIQLENGAFSSDICIGDPDWRIKYNEN